MPELPGPSEDRPDSERQAYLEGAAMVAQLQADQWAIIAKQYREVAEGLDASASDDADTDGDDDGGLGECPDCESDLIDAMGGAICPHCGSRND